MPDVSLITRTRNRPKMLSRTFDSVKGQTHTNLEWIIVNDGGDRDGIDALVAKANAAGLTAQALHLAANQGRSAAANAGFKQATSDYVMLHDDDDTLEPGFIETCLKRLKSSAHPYDGVLTGVMGVWETEEGKVLKRKPYYFPQSPALPLEAIAARNLAPPIAMIFSRSAALKLGGMDEALPVLEDWDFLLRFLQSHDMACVPDVLANYHIREGAKGDAANSALAEHEEYECLIRNKYLQQDLRDGKTGLGFLLASTDRQLQARQVRFYQIVSLMLHPSRWFKPRDRFGNYQK